MIVCSFQHLNEVYRTKDPVEVGNPRFVTGTIQKRSSGSIEFGSLLLSVVSPEQRLRSRRDVVGTPAPVDCNLLCHRHLVPFLVSADDISYFAR